MRLLLRFLLLGLCLGHLACGQFFMQGTDTGNPSGRATMGDLPAKTIEAPLFPLVKTVCDKLISCVSPSGTLCMSSIWYETSIGPKIGFSKENYSLYTVDDSVSSGDYRVVSGNVVNCHMDINALSCSSPEVIAADDPSLHNPFSGIGEMIPESCAGYLEEGEKK